MTPDLQHDAMQHKGETPAQTGNASNPSPHDNTTDPVQHNQLLDAHAEKYLREVASIEDVPDAQDQQDIDETIQKAGKK